MTGEMRETLASICTGQVAFLCIGNSDCGDDGAGMALCRLLQNAGVPHVFEGGRCPESMIPFIRDGQFDTVVFLDALDVQAQPGSIIIMDAEDIVAKYPQISTHKLSLGTLALLAKNGPEPRVTLIGIQPETMVFNNSNNLSAPVGEAVLTLAGHLSNVVMAEPQTAEEHVCN